MAVIQFDFVAHAGDKTPIIELVIDRSKKVNGTTFTRGDRVIAVRWCRRDPSDSEGLTFIYDDNKDVDVLNSTELRAIDFDLDKSPTLTPIRSTRSSSKAKKPQSIRNGTYYLARELEKTIVKANW